MLADVNYPMWFCDGFPISQLPDGINKTTRALVMTRGNLTVVSVTEVALKAANVVSLSLPSGYK